MKFYSIGFPCITISLCIVLFPLNLFILIDISDGCIKQRQFIIDIINNLAVKLVSNCFKRSLKSNKSHSIISRLNYSSMMLLLIYCHQRRKGKKLTKRMDGRVRRVGFVLFYFFPTWLWNHITMGSGKTVRGRVYKVEEKFYV